MIVKGEIFYNPGVFFGIQDLEKMQLLTICLRSFGRDTHFLAYWIMKRDSIPLYFYYMCEYKTNNYMLWLVNKAHGQSMCFSRRSVLRGHFTSVVLAEA